MSASPILLDQIAEAVLYEGYILYPYRPSSQKNRRERFTFGRVYPEAYSLAQNGAEPFVTQTQCLALAASDSPHLQISVRFLHVIAREVGILRNPATSPRDAATPAFAPVQELRVGGKLYQCWQEAREERVELQIDSWPSQGSRCVELPFECNASCEVEPIREGTADVGLISRRQESLCGKVELALQCLGDHLRKISVRVVNRTPLPDAADSDAVLLRTFASTHIALELQGADFVSLMDPPSELKEAARDCHNMGVWPVLIGDESIGQRNTMLAAPIILYDYPKIAPESHGPLFDGTEIDEILSLRILTLSDDEKLEMSCADEHGRELLNRTQSLSREAMLRLHGTTRKPESPAPVEYDDFFGAKKKLTEVKVAGKLLRAGDRVRICPKARADVMDLALRDRVAVIEALEQDLENRVHLALVLEDDPGKDLGLLRQSGHRFFFGLDEVEPLKGQEG